MEDKLNRLTEWTLKNGEDLLDILEGKEETTTFQILDDEEGVEDLEEREKLRLRSKVE